MEDSRAAGNNCSSELSIPSNISLLFSALSQMAVPRGTTSLAAGLSHALWWLHWICLESAVCGTGRPQPLLTEAALQPPLTAPPHVHSSFKKYIRNSRSCTKPHIFLTSPFSSLLGFYFLNVRYLLQKVLSTIRRIIES